MLTPDDLMLGVRPTGKVIAFDDDHHCMGRVLSVLFARAGASVTCATTAGRAGDSSRFTGEQRGAPRQMLVAGIEILISTAVNGFDSESGSLACVYCGACRRAPLRHSCS